ncbi:hypothetical protein [Mycobacterium sp. NPDC050853]|uniref:hypothetical protein n=1 Tax=Mycobacterium sp. NPDC050853 TaxID=3155160 RepID=UPI0033CA535B
MVTPFLSDTEFAGMYPRALSTAETNVVPLLLQVAANWIVTNTPGTPDDSAAKYVTYEVVSNSLTFGKYRGLASFHNMTGHRVQSGTFIKNPATALDFTDEHRQLLGIPMRAGPASSFFVDDFALPSEAGLNSHDSYDYPRGFGSMDNF